MKPNLPEDSTENSKNSTNASDRQNASWDLRNAPKNYISLVLTQGGSAFFSFASVWLITKILGSEGYGGIVAIIAASQIAQVLVNWTTVSVVRFGVEEFIETEKIARTFWLRLFIFLPNLLLVLLTANFWFPPLADWLKLSADTFWLVFLHFTAIALWIHVQYGLQAVKMPRLQGGLMTVERALIFTGIVIFLIVGKLNAISVMLCYAVMPLLTAFIGLIYLRKFIFSRFPLDRQFIKKIVVFSLPLLPFTLVGYFSGSYVDAVFITKFLSTRDLGVYSVATQINGIALQFPTLANSLLTPLFISLQKENRITKLNAYFEDILPSLTLAWGFFCTFLAFAGYFFIPLVFGEEFAGAVLPFWVLLTASTFGFPVFIGYAALSNSLSATYISMYSAIFSALVNISLNFLLIPGYGAEGCAWATVAMYLTITVVFIILLRRRIEIPVSWLFLAITPSICGTIVISFTENPYWATAICVTLTFFVAYLYRSSINKTISFLRNFKKI